MIHIYGFFFQILDISTFPETLSLKLMTQKKIEVVGKIFSFAKIGEGRTLLVIKWFFLQFF